MNTWKLLVVEDDPDGQILVGAMLENLNARYDSAMDAAEAEELLFDSGNTYDAIIIDLALPDKNGWALLRDIQQNPATMDVPCIAVTAFHNSKLREEALEAGFKAYLSKPVDTMMFARALQDVL